MKCRKPKEVFSVRLDKDKVALVKKALALKGKSLSDEFQAHIDKLFSKITGA